MGAEESGPRLMDESEGEPQPQAQRASRLVIHWLAIAAVGLDHSIRRGASLEVIHVRLEIVR